MLVLHVQTNIKANLRWIALSMINSEKNDEIKVTFNGRSVARVSVDYYTYDDDNKFSPTNAFIDTEFDKEQTKYVENKSDPIFAYKQIDLRMDDKWLVHETKDNSGLVIYTEMVPIDKITRLIIYNIESKKPSIKRNQLDDSEAERIK
jgi:hypothetical protein